MPIVYPLTMPATPAPSASSLRLRRVVAVASSPFTGQQQVQEHSGAWWEADIALPPMRRHLAAPWQAWGARLHGRAGMFLMGDPDAKAPRGVATGTPVVFGAGQTGNVLVTSGWTPGAAGILLAGDYVELPGHRLHMVTVDAASDGTGRAELEIEPPLRSSPANGAAIIVNNPRGIWRMASNDLGWSADAASIFGFSFSCVEAL